MITHNLWNEEACRLFVRTRQGTPPANRPLFFPGETIIEPANPQFICEVLERLDDIPAQPMFILGGAQSFRVNVTDIGAGSTIMGVAIQPIHRPEIFRVRNNGTSMIGQKVIYRPRSANRAMSEDFRTANIIANDWIGTVLQRLTDSPYGDVLVKFEHVDRSRDWICIRWSADMLSPNMLQQERWHMRVGDAVRSNDGRFARGVVTEVNDLGSAHTSYTMADMEHDGLALRYRWTWRDNPPFSRYLMDNMLTPHPETPTEHIGETPTTVIEGTVLRLDELRRVLSPEGVSHVSEGFLPNMFAPGMTAQWQDTLGTDLLRRDRNRIEESIRSSFTHLDPNDANLAFVNVDENYSVTTTFVTGESALTESVSRELSNTMDAALTRAATGRTPSNTPAVRLEAYEQRERLRTAIRAFVPSHNVHLADIVITNHPLFIEQFANLMTTPVKPVANERPTLWGGKRKLKSL